MGRISRREPLTHGALPGVRIYPMTSVVVAGEPQEVLVEVGAGFTIPLHSHTVDAAMFVVAGSGEVLSEDAALHGQLVAPGSIVLFEQNVAHGFRAGDQGLSFVSTNGGIVDPTADRWDIAFT